MTTSNYRNKGSGKVFFGLVLVTIGCISVLNELGARLPHWLISFPTFLLALGIFLGVKSQFRKPLPIILIAIGALNLADDIIPQLNLTSLIWPVLIICVGGFLVMGRNKSAREYWKDTAEDFKWRKSGSPTDPLDPTTGSSEIPADESLPGGKPRVDFSAFENTSSSSLAEDYIDTVSIFGGVKKIVTSKNFRGGEVVNFMGGAEINLTQADFTGVVVLDVTQVFGGTKIVVPPHWHVQSEMAAIFGGVEDKRPVHESTESARKLVIKGTSIFGGIDIRSF